MAVQVQAQGGGGVTLGGKLNLDQFGLGSPASWSVGVAVILLAVIVLVVLSLR